MNTHPELSQGDVPVCFAWGEEDDTLDLSYSMEFYNRLYPDSCSIVFPEGQHNLYIDKEIMDSVFLTAIDFFSLHTDH